MHLNCNCVIVSVTSTNSFDCGNRFKVLKCLNVLQGAMSQNRLNVFSEGLLCHMPQIFLAFGSEDAIVDIMSVR